MSTLPEAAGWAEATGIVAKQVFENLLAWLPTLTVPVRTGTHDNTAFGIGLLVRRRYPMWLLWPAAAVSVA